MDAENMLDEHFQAEEMAKEMEAISHMVHIRVQQRTTRKSYTIVEDMPEDIDLKKVVKAFRKILSCGGEVKNNKGKRVILLQGDQRDHVRDFLLEEGIVRADEIKIHGH
jgi:translation initiation factor 1